MTTVPTPEPEGYAVTAAELRRIADALDTLPPVDRPPYVQLSILPEKTVSTVNAVALAVVGKRGEVERIGSEWYLIARNRSTPKTNVHLSVQATVPGPPDERDAKIERLKADLAEARAATETAKSFLGTEGAVAEPKPDTLVVAQGRASVPDMPTHSFVRGGDDGCQWPGCTVNLAHHPLADIVIVPKVPDMQTRPQCSPACRDLYRPDRGVHFLGCPNWSTPMIEQTGGE